jgi:hypothetical protein
MAEFVESEMKGEAGPLEPLTVLYCPHCTMPPEYCEYGPCYEERCLPWKQQQQNDGAENSIANQTQGLNLNENNEENNDEAEEVLCSFSPSVSLTKHRKEMRRRRKRDLDQS